jgi:hypothetical protein
MSGIGSAEHARIPVSTVRRWFQVSAGAGGETIPLLLWGYTGFCLFYGLTIVYGFLDGYALPTTAIFTAVPHGDWIARGEKYLPPGMFFVAILGASLGWISPELPQWRQRQRALISLFLKGALPVICLTFILALSNSGWNGRLVILQGEWSSIAGLIPYSDGADHFLSPMEQVLTGHWTDFASRRPFAAGLRHLIMAIAGFSYVGTLLIQTLLVSATVFAAARSVTLWRGAWAGLAFTALSLALARSYLATMLSEPIGLIWAFLTIMFLVDAMRLGATRYAFLALATLTFGELTRMGSILTIPALCLWIAITFGTKLRERIQLFAAGCVIVALALFIQSLCAWLYGNPNTLIGENFAYTLCGLAVGGDWSTCPKLFAPEFSRLATEREHVSFLFSRAVDIMLRDPSVAIRSMYFNVTTFVRVTPDLIFSGYDNPNKFIPPAMAFLLLPGLFLTTWRKGARGELLFWILIFASMAASAAIIFRDEGSRTFAVTWPLVALFFALGCTSPGSLPLRHARPTFSSRGGVLLVSAIVGLILLSPAVTRIWPGRELQTLSRLAAPKDVHQVILYGPTLTGFVVIPDDTPLPKSVPAMHSTEFVHMIQNIGIERDLGGFLDEALKQVPFAFVTAVPIDPAYNEHMYLAPAEMLTSVPAANAWRVVLGNQLHNSRIHDVVGIEKLP